MSITDARKQKYDFSDPYYDSYVCMAVKSGSSISGYEDLNGKTVAAKTGTMGATCAESLAPKYGFSLTYFDDSSIMYQDVLTGNSDPASRTTRSCPTASPRAMASRS